jgi:hypothetical protein
MFSRIRSHLSAVRSRLSRTRLRIVFLLVIACCAIVLGHAALTGLSTATAEDVPDAEPRDGHTVITESGRAGTITAYEPSGDVLYYNNSRTKYFDVDPVPGDPLTVEYTTTETIHTSGPSCGEPPCAHNLVERVNLTTGETEVIFERINDQEWAGEWHDHVRVNETHILIADIRYDQVYMVDTETGIVDWLWDAQSDFDVETTGGSFPRDWTHLNDIELLDDGRVMVSLRNHDRVVFVEPGSGVDHDWTLGEEDNYDILYEQHNPDYIPESRGGPAVVVADSENSRIKEFQREDGEWVQTWEWTDERMQWPRDADRLPNGNTLIVDTHGTRVVEVTPAGDIEWQVESSLPYDAERLETGPESTGGHSARELGLASRTDGGDADDGGGFSPAGLAKDLSRTVLPHWVINGILFVAPPWMGGAEFAAVAVGLLTGVGWVGTEIRWKFRDFGVTFRSPVYRSEQSEQRTEDAGDGE